MEPNPYRTALFNVSLLAFAGVFLFGLIALVTSGTDPVAASVWLWLAGTSLTIGILFIALWLVVSALRFEVPPEKTDVAVALAEAEGL